MISTIMLLSFLYLGITFFFGNTGFVRYLDLNHTKSSLERDIAGIEAKNRQIKNELKLLKENPFYIEKHAREDFDMARPDEYIFTYER